MRIKANNRQKSTILITGATGFIGRHIVRHLYNQGFKVKALARKQTNLFNDSKVEIVIGDMKDYSSLLYATNKVDGVIHLAAAKSDEQDSNITNIEGAKNLVKACQENKVKYIINISTMSTKISQKGLYAKTKKSADEIFSKSKIRIITLYPSIVYGDSHSGVFGSLVKFSRFPITPIIGSGQVKFRPIYIQDFAKTIQVAIEKINVLKESYDIGGKEEISLNNLVRKTAPLVGNKRIRIFHIPTGVGMFVAKILSLFMSKPPITVSNILGSTQQVSCETSSYFKDFNINPISLENGINNIINSGREEAETLYNYVSYGRIASLPVRDFELNVYLRALKNNNLTLWPSYHEIYSHPLILSLLDYASKIFYPSSSLQKKLRIVSVLVECHPNSAEWLLPKDVPLVNFLVRAVYLSVKSAIKLVGGMSLMLIPGFVKRNVE